MGMDEDKWDRLLKIRTAGRDNARTAARVARTAFELADAEHFPVPEQVDRIYFQ